MNRVHGSHGTLSFAALSFVLASALPAPGQAQEDARDDAGDVAALRAEIEDLKRMLPSQSHTMADVEYHFTNLWFAGMDHDWPLATFYLNETRSHLNWTVRLHPVRRTSTGDVDLRPILDGVEKSGLANLAKAIDAQDAHAFEEAYRGMLNECYACHQASEKPYLRPEVPLVPASPLMIHGSR